MLIPLFVVGCLYDEFQQEVDQINMIYEYDQLNGESLEPAAQTVVILVKNE